MRFTVMDQTWTFLWSIALGAALGVCYDFFRVLRLTFPHPNWAVALEDIFFAFLCAGATFCYQVVSDCGRIRIFVLVGEAVGFTIYHCTVGVLVMRAAGWLVRLLKRFLKLLDWIFLRPLRFVLRKIMDFLRHTKGCLAKHLKKEGKNPRKPLQFTGGILYNLKKRAPKGKCGIFRKSRVQGHEKSKI